MGGQAGDAPAFTDVMAAARSPMPWTATHQTGRGHG